jgi:hypothetical protein
VILEPAGARQTVLYFGGNMFRISAMGAEAARRLMPLGVRLVLVDHRGYGRSEGAAPSLAQLEADAVEVYDAVAELPGVERAQLIVHGHSLGSFLAAAVTDQRKVAGLVLECSATTGSEWIRAADRRPWYARLVSRIEVEPSLADAGNLRRVQRLKSPLLILAGSLDRTTPPALSSTLFDRAATPDTLKTLYVFKGADHNNVSAAPEFARVYQKFLQRVALLALI